MPDHAAIRRALAALADAARERVDRHPLGHLTSGRETVELPLRLPLHAGDDAVGAAAAELAARLDAEVEGLLAHHAAFRPGRVLCLRCASADCEHAVAPGPRAVFAGYGPSGVPRFVDFAQLLLERQDPRVDRLFADPPPLLAVVVSGRELAADLLPAFRDRQTDYHVHGQVVAGWFAVPGRDGGRARLALTFQVISSRGRGGARRLGLNVLGAGEGGEALARLCDRLAEIPWSPSVRWGQSILASVERQQGRPGVTPERLSQRVAGMLQSIAGRLEQGRRARDRRTRHAEERHGQGDRPTRMALVDLARATPERLLADTRQGTLVVLGERGRAHVWNPHGKLVTSIRFTPESLERRRRQGRWRPASASAVAGLRAAVAAAHPDLEEVHVPDAGAPAS